MAVSDKVVIKVEIDADIDKDLTRIEARLRNLGKASSSTTRDVDRLDKAVKRAGDRTDLLRKRIDKNTNSMQKFRMVLRSVTSAIGLMVKTLAKFSFIALAGQVALFTAGLLGVKAALITGRFAVKAYEATLRGLSVAASSVAVSLAVAAAAMREFQSVQLAPNMGGFAPGTGGRPSGFVRATRMTRAFMGTQTSGLMGSEASSGTLAALSKVKGVGAGNVNMLTRQLFNLSGGDGKAVQALAGALGGGDLAKAKAAISGAAGFRKGSLDNVTTMAGLLSAIGSGGAVADNFQGLGAAMADSFIGRMKTQFGSLVRMFADLGDVFLGPAQNTMVNIARIIREDLMSMSASLNTFGVNSFLPTLETTVDKVSKFIRNIVIQDMARISEIGENFVNFFKSIGSFFSRLGNFFRSYEPAANVLLDMFRAMSNTGGGRKLFRNFSDLILENADAFKEFGASIGRVFGALFDLMKGGQIGIFGNLERLAKGFDIAARKLIPAFGKILDAITPILDKIPQAIEGIAAALNMVAPILKTLAEVVGMLFGALGAFSPAMTGMALLGGGALFMGGGARGRRRGLMRFGRNARGGGSRFFSGAGARAATMGGGLINPADAAAAGMYVMPTGQVINQPFGMMSGVGGRIATGLGRFFNSAGSARGDIDPLHANPHMRGSTLGSRLHERFKTSRFNLFRDGRIGVGTPYLVDDYDEFGNLRYLKQRDSHSSIKAGYFNRNSKRMAGVRSMGVGNRLMMGVGGAMQAYGGIQSMGSEGMGVMNTLSTGMGGAMAGFAVAGPVGAAVGAIGAITVGAFMSIRRSKRLKKAAEKEYQNFIGDVTGSIVGDMGGKAGVDAMRRRSELLKAAIESGDGDTQAMEDFLRNEGIDPTSVHRDDMLDKLIAGDALGEVNELIRASDELFKNQVASVSDATGIAIDKVEELAEKIGVDFFDSVNKVLATVMMVATMNRVSLTDFIEPDFTGSAADKLNRGETIIGLKQGLIGEFDESVLSELISTQAANEMMAGASPIAASLIAMETLRAEVNTPAGRAMYGASAPQMLDSLDQGIINVLRRISTENNIDFDLLQSMFAGGSHAGRLAFESGATAGYQALGGIAIEQFLTGVAVDRMALDATSDMKLSERYSTLTGLEGVGAFSKQDKIDFLKLVYEDDEDMLAELTSDRPNFGQVDSMFNTALQDSRNTGDLFQVLPDAIKNEKQLLMDINSTLEENLEMTRILNVEVEGDAGESGTVEEGESINVNLTVVNDDAPGKGGRYRN